ncbi:MAG: ACT domain-containing protein [Clostridia bacterium]|nr:ACT domain-containing protein [Clostridia bacterium]
MKAILTVLGRDTVGILAKVSTECAAVQGNIIEVTQSVLQEMFAMIMLVDITNLTCSLPEFQQRLVEMGQREQLVIHVMHEDIFNSMHRI